ncbi:uncharacterized protein LOC114420582 [Glycine soja]|uniref:uncharacterized protein LOC114420582 n=1 Tax=Glycine soja TaxID=3848 RepID=UPI00103F4A66|nr:uncharacterized protein LOC114420582 [Glycine soja]
MICDLGQEGFQQAHTTLYDNIEIDSKKPLYAGCTSFTKLSAVLALVNLKARFGWSDKSFSEMLILLKNILPADNVLPKNHYEANKILCPVGMYKLKNGDSSVHPNAGNPRPAKVCWYLPIIPRLKRLFANGEDAKNLTWHADSRKSDGLLRHPADSPQWKAIDCLYFDFGAEPRNLRLGLATGGMNPYGNLSMRPVLLFIYNLPSWLCMKRKYVMLSMMIPGPRQPGNDIDVYLRPLIDDLRKLWEEGVNVWDANLQPSFLLRAMVFCTINDFLAYGNLSGYSVKGYHACPICEQNTSFRQLKHGKKIVYTRHRRFLKPYHPYRRLKKAFDGSQEHETAPNPLSGDEVYDRVKDVLVGLKSHDCHVLMQQLLPVAIRGTLPEKVCVAITRLCFIFNAICAKVIDPKQLDDLKNEVSMVLCQMEMYFLPSFYDIMVHLVVHLVREIRCCGPVFLRWMYPVERYMKVLKGYTKNQYRPEASIVERYVAEECIEFASQYVESLKPVGLPSSRHDQPKVGKGTRGYNVVTMTRHDVSQAHLYILNNTPEVLPYIEAHKKHVRETHPKMNMMRVLQEHNKTFINWFRQTIFADNSVSKRLTLLAIVPNLNVPTWKGYDINNYSFYTKSQDDKSSVQNSGVSVDANSDHFCSTSDNNPIRASMCYYGVIQEIWEVVYTTFRLPVFKCQWVNGTTGVHQDPLGFTLVDLSKVVYMEEPFIMAEQARQVFYVDDPCNSSLIMATPLRSPPQSDGQSEATSKRSRTMTRLRRLTLRTMDQPRPAIYVDPATGRASGPMREKFHSYIGVVAREKVPIIHNNWKDVPETLKEIVWNDILFDIPEAAKEKTKVMPTVATRWRQFKSTLTSKFVFGNTKGQQTQDVVTKYGLDPEAWKQFEATRVTPNWETILAELIGPV